MGVGASIATLKTVKKELEKLPEIFDEDTARKILVLDFDREVFHDLLKAKELLRKSTLLKYYDKLCDSAVSVVDTEASLASSPNTDCPAPEESKYARDRSTTNFKAMHSLLRWNKPAKRATLENILKSDPCAVVRRELRHTFDPRSCHLRRTLE